MTKKTMVYCYKIDSTFDKQCMIHCDPFCCPPNIDQGCIYIYIYVPIASNLYGEKLKKKWKSQISNTFYHPRNEFLLATKPLGTQSFWRIPNFLCGLLFIAQNLNPSFRTGFYGIISEFFSFTKVFSSEKIFFFDKLNLALSYEKKNS